MMRSLGSCLCNCMSLDYRQIITYLGEEVLNRLRALNFFTRFNIIISIIHGGIGVALFSASNASFACAMHCPNKEVFRIPLRYIIGFSEIVTSLIHFSLESILCSRYYEFLRNRCNPFRWIEYSITAPCVFTVLHCLASTKATLTEIVACFILIHTTMYFGLLSEFLSSPLAQSGMLWTRPLHVRLVPHLLGYLPCTVALVLMLLPSFFGTVTYDAPLTILLLLEMLQFCAFALTQLVFLILTPSYYAHVEYVNCFLSLTSKSTVAMYIVLMPYM